MFGGRERECVSVYFMNVYPPPAYTYTPYIIYVYTNLLFVVNAIPSPVFNATRYTVHVSDGANPWVRSTLYSLAALDSGT